MECTHRIDDDDVSFAWCARRSTNAVLTTQLPLLGDQQMTVHCGRSYRRLLLEIGLVTLSLAAAAQSGFSQTRPAVPSEERQKEIVKDLDGVYNLSRLENLTAKQDALKKLMEASRDANLESAELYVVLATAMSLARESGDTVSWLTAANMVVDTFATDPLQEKTRLLTEYLKGAKSAKQLKLAIEEAIATSQMAASKNRYVEAKPLLAAAAIAVSQAKGADNLKKLVADATDLLAAREKGWKEFETARTKLETKPDDAAANFVVGQWFVLQNADWKNALPFLAKGNNAKWKEAAELERTDPTDPTTQIAVGDKWFDLGEAESGATKSALLLHAGEWYENVQPQITSVLKKQALAKRIDKIALLKPKPLTTSVESNASTQPPGQSKAWHGWPVTAPPPAIAPFSAEQAKRHQEDWAAYLKTPIEHTNTIGMKFHLVPPGEFLMGSTAAEIEEAVLDAGSDENRKKFVRSEAPLHKVVLTQPIYVGVHEVTQAQYETVMKAKPSNYSASGGGKAAVAGVDTADHPVEMASWNDAAEFCAKLSKQEKLKPFYLREGEMIKLLNGTGYRLPTEAEWEFACRAGTTTKFWIGDREEDLNTVAWLLANSGGRPHIVGKLPANQFGLFDMHGNVWEWVHEDWDATYYGQFSKEQAINPNHPFSANSLRIVRGGHFNHTALFSRSSARRAFPPSTHGGDIGFRVTLVVGTPGARRP